MQSYLKKELQELALRADKFILLVLWLHLPFAGFIAPYSYGTVKEGLIASLFLCTIGTISYIFSRGTLAHRILNGLLLISFSIVLISIQYGRIEMHFHVFASLPLLILYRDWRVVPPSALLTAFHHSFFNYCQQNNLNFMDFPLIAFNYGSGWDIVLLHSFFVVIESLALMYYAIILRRQFIEIIHSTKNLEKLVSERTDSLRKEKEKIEGYNKALDEVAIISLTDIKGNIIEINKNFEKISGYSKSELIGQSHSLLKSSQHRKSFFQDMWTTIKEGNVWRGEVCNKKKDDEEYWVQIAIAPLRNRDGNVTHFLSIGFDISEKKEDEKVILQQQEQIVSQAQLSSLGEMAGGIAHEINNPLAIISTTISTIKKMVKKKLTHTESFENSIQNIENTVLRITKIVSGLRNLSRDSSKENFDECSIQDIIEDVLPLCSEKFKNFRIQLKIHVDPELITLKIEVMRVQLSQVLLNLLTNAFDEISSKGYIEEKWITINVTNHSTYIKIRVEDCGAGIPIELQEKIFNPFFTTKGVGKGTGLGLSLSNTIIKKHNGHFYIDNSRRNTCFVIELPKNQKANVT